MNKNSFSALFCIGLALLFTACAHPYEGKHFSHSYPHSIYRGLPLMESITMGSTNGAVVTFDYTMSPVDKNKYSVKGTMHMSNRVQSYSDMNIYMLLLDRGEVVKAIRMNASSSSFADNISFFKDFEIDKNFTAVTFDFNIRYYL